MATVLPTAPCSPSTSKWQSLRASVRYKCAPATPAKIRCEDDTEHQRVWVIDLSQRGAGLEMSRPLECGTRLTVRLKGPESTAVLEIASQVVHCTLQSNGEWLVGCEFDTMLTPEQLDDLL